MSNITYKTPQELQTESSLKSLFATLDGNRTTILNKARACSALTIPSVLPDSSFTEQTSLPDTYNSLGARAVNNLSNKLLLGLLPPNSSFFTLEIVNEKLQQDVNSSGVSTEVQAKLSSIEQAIRQQIEVSGMRPIVHQAFIHLIVTGNAALLYENGTMSLYKLDSYVVERDYSGNIINVVLKEKINYNALPEDLITKLSLTESDKDKDIDLYTRYIKQGSNWLTYQEVNDVPVDGSEQTIKEDNMPLMVLRWSKINGENYGRGLVEQMIGDFRSLEGLTQLMIEYSAIAAKVIFGVRPGSPIEINELEEAENGGVIVGNLEQDVTRLGVNKQADLQIPLKLTDDITRRISAAFLMNSTAVRDSERTTAYEIQYLARELEDALGGIYSIISQEFQLPLVKLLMADLKYDLGSGVEPAITTGLSALGRTQDLEKIRQLNHLIAEVNPDYVVKYLNVQEYLKRIGADLGIRDVDSLFISKDEVAQEQQGLTDANVPNVQDPNKVNQTQGVNNG